MDPHRRMGCQDHQSFNRNLRRRTTTQSAQQNPLRRMSSKNQWATAFAEAAAVGVAEGCEADNEFFRTSNSIQEESGTSDTVNRVSELARSCISRNRNKRPRQQSLSDDQAPITRNDTDERDISLEGVLHENEIVLLDRKNRRVLSSSDRTDDGDHVEIGKLDEGGCIKLFDRGTS